MNLLLATLNDMPMWLVCVSIIIGFANCFLGYKLLRVWFALIGFVIGMVAGYMLSYKYVSNMVIPIIVGFLAGIIVGYIAYRVYLVGVFLMALVGTFGFIGQLLAHYNEPGWLWLSLTAVLAVVVAIVALKFVKPVIIISSALNGGVLMMSGIFKLLAIDAKHMIVLAAMLLAILGIMVQFFTTKNSKPVK